MQTRARPAHLHLTLPGWDLLIRPHITQPRCMATEELLCTATYILTLISALSSFVSFILIFVEGKKSRGCKKLQSGPEHSGARLLMPPHPRSTWRSMWRHRCGHRALHQLQLGPVSLGSSCSWDLCHEDPAAAVSRVHSWQQVAAVLDGALVTLPRLQVSRSTEISTLSLSHRVQRRHIPRHAIS